MLRKRRIGFALGLPVAAALVAPALVAAPTVATAAFPEKPIKLVVPFRAGGGSDALARQLQAVIKKHNLLPQPLVIVNVTGAGGTIGSKSVLNAKPDGYTILQIHQEMLAVSAAGRVTYKPSDFTPVIQTTRACLYLAVPASQPFKTFKELADYGKKNPGKLKQADIIGGVGHFPAVMLMNATGARFGIVQSGGTSKRFAMMKGGFAQLAFMSPGWIKRGGDQLRGLLWLGPTRHPAAPNMPTAKELGLDVSACLKRRFWAPKGTPADRVKVIADAFEKAMKTPEMIAYHKKRLSDVSIVRGEQLRKEIADEYASYVKVAPDVKKSMMKK
ncbi:MAG: tripartite tricarboxylate transporter substrate binding protein [Bauldia litoralis]